MFKKTAIPLFFFLFFLLSFSNTYAFTLFNENAWFNNDYGGIVAVNNYSTDFSWNETCYGFDGCFQVETNATPSYVNIYLGNDETLFISPFTELGVYQNYTIFTLPAFKEAHIYLQYYSNTTLGGFTGILSNPMLYIIADSSVISSTTLSPTANQWNNYTVFIDDALLDRSIQIEFGYSTIIETNLMINKFDFFTYDDDQISATASPKTTLQEMCNQTSSDIAFSYSTALSAGCLHGFGLLTDSAITMNGSVTQFEFYHGRDNITCLAYQYGNIVSSRYAFGYCVGEISGGTNTGSYAMHSKDMTIIKGKDNAIGGDFTLYINKFASAVGLQCSMPILDSPSNYVANSFNNSIYGGYAKSGSDNWTQCAKAFKTDLSNVTFTGSYWYIGATGASSGGMNSSIHWGYFQQACNSGQSCTNNSEQWVSNDCSVSTIRSCGDCGCNADLMNCNDAGFVGTRCISSDVNHHLYEISDNCTSYVRTCDLVGKDYDGWCEDSVWHPNITTWTLPSTNIVCWDWVTDEKAYIINEIGNNESYPSGVTTADLYTNPFNYVAILFGSLFGMGSKDYLYYTVPMLAITISLIVGFIGLYLGLHSKKAGEIFALSFLGTLTVLTFGLNNISLWALYTVIIIMSAGIMTGFFRKIIGGG